MMCREIDWTRQLGSAFTSDQKAVLDAVQRLRTQAANAGNLESTPEQTVEKKTEGDKVIVEVKPADPKVVYVPQYDPQVAYSPAPVSPAPPAPATSESSATVGTDAAIAGGVLAFGVGVILGKALEDDDDYCYPHWGAGAVYVGPRPFYPPAYVYRPAYGPGFHPAYRYAPPAGYRNAYNNVNVNVNRNVVVDNNDYFNRFNNNRNLQVNAPRAEARTAEPRHNENWRGQSTYAGARTATEARAGAEAHTPGDARAAKEARAVPRVEQHVDRGYGSSTRDLPAARETHTREAATPAARPHEPRARQHEPGAAPQPDTRAAREAREVARHDEGAFATARREDAGSFERASSARGRARLGGRDVRTARHR